MDHTQGAEAIERKHACAEVDGLGTAGIQRRRQRGNGDRFEQRYLNH